MLHFSYNESVGHENIIFIETLILTVAFSSINGKLNEKTQRGITNCPCSEERNSVIAINIIKNLNLTPLSISCFGTYAAIMNFHDSRA